MGWAKARLRAPGDGEKVPAREPASHFAGHEKLLLVAAAVGWALLLLQVSRAFGPETAINEIPYSSDSAIPVLMVNTGTPFSPESFYYYGTDRWGAWAFLLPALVHRLTGLWWTPHMLFVLLASWILLGAYLAGALAPRDRHALSLIYVLVLCLQKDARYSLFEISQVYAWILTSILLTWLCLRRLFDRGRSPGRPAWGRRAGLLGAMLLALLSSIAAAPLVAAILGLEAARARLRGREDWRSTLGWAAGLFSTALAVEELFRWACDHLVFLRFGQRLRWLYSLDAGFLAQNLSRHIRQLASQSWSALYVVPPLAISLFAAWWLYRVLAGRAPEAPRLQAALADDTVVFACGTFGLALLNLLFAVGLDHVRLSGYDPKFLAIAQLLAPVSGLTILYLAVVRPFEKSRWHVQAALVALGVVVLILGMPHRRLSPQYENLERIARDLAAKAPGGVLMGGYWETYVFASLQPKQTMTPVPVYVLRTPWTLETARKAARIVVEYRHSGLGRAGSPPEHLRPYGVPLRLEQARWYVDGEYAFALYANESVHGARAPSALLGASGR